MINMIYFKIYILRYLNNLNREAWNSFNRPSGVVIFITVNSTKEPQEASHSGTNKQVTIPLKSQRGCGEYVRLKIVNSITVTTSHVLILCQVTWLNIQRIFRNEK